MEKPNKFSFKNRNNKKIEGILQINTNPNGVVFLAHGLGGHMHQKHIQAISRAFLENGYTVIRWNAWHTITDKRNNLENGTPTTYLHDLEDVIKWASSQSWYSEPFILAGHSLGSFVELIYAIKNLQKVKAMAPTSAAVSGKFYIATKTPKEIENWKARGFWQGASESRPGVVMRLRLKFLADFLRYDVLKNVGKLTVPILLVVGSEDEITPLYQQKILLEKLGSKNKQLKIIKNSPHTFREANELKILEKYINEWCRQL